MKPEYLRPFKPRSHWILPAGCCWEPIFTAVDTILEGLPIDVIGLNCSTGPEHMREPIRFLGEQTTSTCFLHSKCRIAVECGWTGCLSYGTAAFRRCID